MVQEFGSSLPGELRCRLALQSSKGVSKAERSVTEMATQAAVSPRPQALDSSYKEASLPQPGSFYRAA